MCLESGAASKETIKVVIEKALGLVEKELEELFKRSRFYKHVLKAISLGATSWSSIKRAVEAWTGRGLTNAKMTRLINTVINLSIVEKTDGEYKIADPLIAEYCKNLIRGQLNILDTANDMLGTHFSQRPLMVAHHLQKHGESWLHRTQKVFKLKNRVHAGNTLGHVWVKAKVGDEALVNVVEVDALVDTGATLTVIPRRIALDLNLKPTGRSAVETGAGRLELERSRIWIELEGRSEVVPVLISDVIDKVLIGTTTLEVLGLQVDPLTGKLKEWTLLLY